MTISKEGNVGIGTTSPAQLLHVNGGQIRVNQGTSGVAMGEYSSGAVIWLDGANGDFSGGDYFNIRANDSAQLTFGYAGGEQLYLTSNGKLGVGVVPNSANVLQVNGQARATTAMFGNSSAGNVAAKPIHIKYGGPASLRLEDSEGSNLVYDLTSDYGTGFIIRDETAGTNRLTIAASTGDATFSNDVIITGGLTVNGATTTVDTTNLLVEDPLILLAKNQTGQTLDSGFIIERGSHNNAGFIWDESADEFACIQTTDTATTAGNITIANYANLHTGALTVSSNISVANQILTPGGSNLALNPNTGLVTVGGALSTTGNVTVGGTLTENSSIALKENVFDLNTTLEKISKVRPVKYNKKVSKDKKEIGLIAEELALIFPELVENDENGNPTSVNYTRAVTVLFDGFKQMYKELKEIKEKIK